MNQFRNISQIGGKLSVFGGINLILLSIAIFFYPQILAYAVAAILMVAGLGLLACGRKIRRRSSGQSNFSEGTTYYYTK